MFKITKFWASLFVVIVAAALFLDLYPGTLFGHTGVTPALGLDLTGGTEVTVAICKGVNNPPGANCRQGLQPGEDLGSVQQATITILQQRVNQLGVSEASVQAQGSDQVLVQLPGKDLAQAETAVGKTGKLYFATAVPGAPPGCTSSGCDPAAAARLLAHPDAATSAFIADQQGLYDTSQFNDTLFYPSGYHWKIDNNLPANDVTSASVGTDQNTGQIAVDITFNSQGAAEWSKITQAAYSVYTSNPSSPQAQIAIFLDTQVITAPVVQQGGQSNQTQITGNFTPQAAQQLADDISAGALPAQIGVVQATSVSATLGAQTVTASLIAGAVGLILVIIFMVGYYRFPGVLAALALLMYAAITYAIFKFLVTMSLAGLAGFVLSVGMAVDANVLIFERTRDELRHGRTVPIAIETGFRRAFPAIRDSNVSTLIACVVLGFLGFSVVQGFAITLGIGVAVSFFTAITITRSLFALVLRWRMGRNPRAYTEIHEEYEERPPKGRFDIVRARNWYFLGSLAIIIPGILAIIIWGFNLGIDFRGGNRIDVQLSRPATQAQMFSTVNGVASDLRPMVEAEFAGASAGDHFAITTFPAGYDRVQSILTAVQKQYGISKDVKTGQPNEQVQQVGPTIASSLVTTAVILVLVSAFLITLYLAFAFRGQRAISPWRFSVCTFLKLLHDVFVLAGIWAILGHFSDLGQVDQNFVTALLISVAFSIHDTIVVFDRVRENLRVGPRLTFDQVVNLSTVQTMTRSLNTSLTVVFVLLSLVIFGGATIRGFVLALLIGIITGTYSSIFNASTLLVAWQKATRRQTPSAPAAARRVQVRTA